MKKSSLGRDKDEEEVVEIDGKKGKVLMIEALKIFLRG